MTAPSVREYVEDALAYHIGLIKPATDSNYVNTVKKVLRRPRADMTGRDGEVVLYPGREEYIGSDGRINIVGSGVLNKTLLISWNVYYKDTTETGRKRFDWLADFEYLVGKFNQLVYEGASRADLILPHGNFWGGMADGQSDTYLAFAARIWYGQRFTDPRRDA